MRLDRSTQSRRADDMLPAVKTAGQKVRFCHPSRAAAAENSGSFTGLSRVLNSPGMQRPYSSYISWSICRSVRVIRSSRLLDLRPSGNSEIENLCEIKQLWL